VVDLVSNNPQMLPWLSYVGSGDVVMCSWYAFLCIGVRSLDWRVFAIDVLNLEAENSSRSNGVGVQDCTHLQVDFLTADIQFMKERVRYRYVGRLVV